MTPIQISDFGLFFSQFNGYPDDAGTNLTSIICKTGDADTFSNRCYGVRDAENDRIY